MKRRLAGLALVLGTTALSGCYYAGYSYVRSNGYQGDAYYGEGPSVIYEPDNYGYYGGYYGPGWGYGCCYSSGVSVGISGVWRGDSHHYRGRDWSRERYRDRDDHDDRRDWRRREDRDRGRDRGGDWRERRDHDGH